MNRQRSEIGILAGLHDLVHGCSRRRHFDRLERLAQAFPQHGGKLLLVGVERGGKPTARTHDVGDQFGLLRADIAEPHRLRIAVDHRGDVDQVDRVIVNYAFALLHQLFDEAAQAEFFGVGLGHGHGVPDRR